MEMKILFDRKRLDRTLLAGWTVSFRYHVLALYQSEEGRQIAPPLEHSGELPGSRRQGRPAPGALSGKDQQLPTWAWRKTIEVLENRSPSARILALFPEDREIDD
jgi:hypothetical protein